MSKGSEREFTREMRERIINGKGWGKKNSICAQALSDVLTGVAVRCPD